MDKKIIGFLFMISIITSCAKEYTPQEISESYCECIELSKDKKRTCVKGWSIKYKGTLKSEKDEREVNYNMIECNGFEGDNDFYLKLVDH